MAAYPIAWWSPRCVALRDFPVVPPMIVNGKILAPPRAFDLKTGKPEHLASPLSGEPLLPFGVGNGGCGTYSASACPALMFLRSGSLGIYDMATETGMHWLGQVRPGCWINTLPAGGIVLMPEGSSSCTCAYSFQTSLALVPDTRHEGWGVYTSEGPKRGERLTTVSMNFDAVGDKRDKAEKLWLGFPRPFSPQALKVPLDTSAGVEYYRQNADEISIADTDRPWLYSCGLEGLDLATLDLNLTRPAVVLRTVQTPHIDGKLDDACWDGEEPIDFVDDSRPPPARDSQGKAAEGQRSGLPEKIGKRLSSRLQKCGLQRSPWRRALIKEIEGILASDTISIGLVPSSNSKHPAILSAIEMFACTNACTKNWDT